MSLDPPPSPARINGGVKVVVTPPHQPCMLHCNASGWPRPSVTWWRESIMLPRFSERYEQFVNYTLKIRQMRTEDVGPYECRAYNGIGQVAVWEVTVFLDGVLDPNNADLKYYGPESGVTLAALSATNKPLEPETNQPSLPDHNINNRYDGGFENTNQITDLSDQSTTSTLSTTTTTLTPDWNENDGTHLNGDRWPPVPQQPPQIPNGAGKMACFNDKSDMESFLSTFFPRNVYFTNQNHF